MIELPLDAIKILTPPESGKLLIISIGNPYRCDDGICLFIAERIQAKTNRLVLNVQDQPENALTAAVSMKPERIVIMDSADFQGETGEIRVLNEENIPATSLSTHRFPPRIIAELLKADTGSDVFFLGIQIKNVSYGSEICPEVRESAEAILKFLNEG